MDAVEGDAPRRIISYDAIDLRRVAVRDGAFGGDKEERHRTRLLPFPRRMSPPFGVGQIEVPCRSLRSLPGAFALFRRIPGQTLRVAHMTRQRDNEGKKRQLRRCFHCRLFSFSEKSSRSSGFNRRRWKRQAKV